MIIYSDLEIFFEKILPTTFRLLRNPSPAAHGDLDANFMEITRQEFRPILLSIEVALIAVYNRKPISSPSVTIWALICINHKLI